MPERHLPAKARIAAEITLTAAGLASIASGLVWSGESLKNAHKQESNLQTSQGYIGQPGENGFPFWTFPILGGATIAFFGAGLTIQEKTRRNPQE